MNRIAPIIISLIERSRSQDRFFDRNASIYISIIAHLAISTIGCGDVVRGWQLLEKAFALAAETNNLASRVYIEWATASCSAFSMPRRPSDRWRRRSAISPIRRTCCRGSVGAGWATPCMADNAGEDLGYIEKGMKMHTELGVPYWLSFCHFFSSTARFELGEMAKAREDAELALQCALNNNEKQVQGLTRAWLGRVLEATAPGQ